MKIKYDLDRIDVLYLVAIIVIIILIIIGLFK